MASAVGKVTLNCDMGESFGLYTMGDDAAMFPLIDLANVACGFHASDPSVMSQTVKRAKEFGISVGAHPSFPDLQGFGRREMKLTPEEVRDSVMYQTGALQGFLASSNMQLSHIKPHGSLYGVTTRDEALCRALLEAVKSFNVPLVGMAGTLHESIAKEMQIRFLAEFFADLGYDDDGKLIITRTHEAVDPAEAASRVMRALKCGKIKSVNGKDIAVRADTICVHSDTPGSVEVAKAVRGVVDTFNMKGGKGPDSSLQIKNVLVANRGEIACRIIKTCKKMRIKTTAIYESADADTRHTVLADESVELPAESGYTSVEAIVDICKANGVDAVHPGYGFLSENPKFSKALQEAGVTFLGPSADCIDVFGLKHVARRLATDAGVPVVPGSGLLEDPEEALKEANQLGYPVMLKATGGGGGIGMRICNDATELKHAFDSCRSLAEKHFGNAEVYMEKYFPQSRHIEVQIFGNGLGEVIHLGERECSVQRRNQKVIEETPSPFLETRPALRREMCAAAVKLAAKLHYESAGTVEFLVVDEGPSSDRTGQFYFLEMNTRLQVEHGVTELVNGVDLVEWMILQGNARRAGKGGLDLTSFHWRPAGHAIEVRVCAENPVRNFQPSPGLLTQVQWTDDKSVRVDTWVETGTNISALYDPLIAKVMVAGENRKESTRKMLTALQDSKLAGPCINLEYLQEVLKSDLFASGNTTTEILNLIEFRPFAVEVIQGGMESTVQDLPGRMPLRVYGIQPSGPMDDFAFKVANVLVGNEETAAGLEITMQGPQLLFHCARTIAVAGAPMPLTFRSSRDAQSVEFPMWSRVSVPAGGIISVGKIPKDRAGCRCYLAVAGGLDVPEFLGSKSTIPAFGFGGHQGRALQAGDMIPLSSDPKNLLFGVEFVLPERVQPKYGHHWNIKVLPGPFTDPDYITAEGMKEIFSSNWTVHYHSNRMGIRFVGPQPKWVRKDGGEGGSHPSNTHDYAYAMGSINFTGDSPVILTMEGPTQGGFVCAWTVVSCELWKSGQVRPGDTLRFTPVSYDAALELRAEYDACLKHIKTLRVHSPMPVPQKDFNRVLDCQIDLEPEEVSTRALLLELPSDPERKRPATQYRQAGDCYVLVEYGDPMGPFDLNLQARVKVMQDTLRLVTDTRTRRVPDPLITGTLDSAPCIRSLLIRYDPDVIHQSTLVQYLVSLEERMPDCNSMVFPSRMIHMPLAFDDRWCKDATQRYINFIRKEASYLPSNVEFIAQNNGLTGGKKEVCEKVTGSPWLVVGVGFFVGCPFMVSVHPLHRLNVPKYNPARTYTAAGTVGIGGNFAAIYPLETPGGYQMFGRTVPTWNTFGTVEPFQSHQPWLLQLYDQVVFDVVSEDELLRCRKLALAGKYKYNITETVFDMTKQNKLVEELKDEIAAMRKSQRQANAKMLAVEADILKKQAAADAQVMPQEPPSELPDNQFTVEAGMPGCVKSIEVQRGDLVTANGTVVCYLEAMKTQVAVTSDEGGKVCQVLVAEKQQVTAQTVVCILERLA